MRCRHKAFTGVIIAGLLIVGTSIRLSMTPKAENSSGISLVDDVGNVDIAHDRTTELLADFHREMDAARPKNTIPDAIEDSEADVPFSKGQVEVSRSIMNFLRTGDMQDIRELEREDVKDLVQTYLSNVPLSQVATALELQLGVPPAVFFGADSPSGYLMDMYDATCGNFKKTELRSGLIFTDECSGGGEVLGSVYQLPTGTETVYAVFENQAALEGLEYVYAIWRDLGDDRMQFSEYESLRIDSRYNYVWLKLGDGWPEGVYQLDLVDAGKPSRILASSKFKVNNGGSVK